MARRRRRAECLKTGRPNAFEIRQGARCAWLIAKSDFAINGFVADAEN
jgi:hypothetical protein